MSEKEDKEKLIREFINQGHPPASEYINWQEKIRTFGEVVPAILIDILEKGDPNQKPAAIYGLRAFGYEAWIEWQGEIEYYKVKNPELDNWLTIKALIPTPSFEMF